MTVQAVGHLPANLARSSRHGWVWIAAMAGGMAMIAIAAVTPSVASGSGTGHYRGR